AHLAKSLV
ncbi:dicarboxylate symporter family protein, partial [Vibrio parahaemolyticus V-223/04]